WLRQESRLRDDGQEQAAGEGAARHDRDGGRRGHGRASIDRRGPASTSAWWDRPWSRGPLVGYGPGRMRFVLLVVLLLATRSGAEHRHLGVGACAGAMCHGGVAPWAGSHVRQDEYHVWRDRDAHARAYAVLDDDDANRIMRHLGGGEAKRDPRCLACHADDVLADR